jgi:glycerol-3-phosphate dehydrogenase
MALNTFNKRSRPAIFRQLSEETFDLLVIGGGITGASVFRDAALRGMKVALVEAKDFASATSGRSSKLIHGGLRYIKNLGLRLAWESCHERNLHIRLNKRLVRPLPFLVPLYRDRGERRGAMRLGMLVYEALSGFNNHRFHSFLSREETLSLAPALPADGLTGGCLYYDAVINDSRWTMEVLKDGVAHNGVAVNYSPVTQLLTENNRVVGARVHDELSGTHYDIRARVVVNATGIFTDQIRQLDGDQKTKARRFSKGTHLVFAEEDVPLSTTIVFASPLDGRSLFLAKHEECFLYGTSDHWEEARPDLPIPASTDVEYLLESLNRFMPEAQLDRSKVQFIYSGFRPLFANGDQSTDPAAVTREDHIEVSPSGLVSVVGGKLTTARITAERVLDRVIKIIGRNPSWSNCSTHRVSIGGTNEAVAESLAYWVRRCPRLTSYFRVLYQRYGLDADEICAEVTRLQEGEPIRAEVQYVCRHEMVCTLEDLIDRRAGFLYWNAAKRLERLRYGAHIIRAELDLTEDEFQSQYLAYDAHLKRFHSLPNAEGSP